MKFTKWFSRWSTSPDDENEIPKIEARISEIMTLKEPRPQFIKTLRQNLLRQYPNVEMIKPAHQYQVLQTGLLVTGGIIGGIFVLLTSVRGLISILGFVGLLVGWIKQNSSDPLTTQNIAH